MGLFTQLCHWIGVLQTIRKKSNERVNQILYEGRCIKEQIYFELVYFSAYRSLAKVSKKKTVFPLWNFVQSLKLHYKIQFLSIIANRPTELDFSTVNWEAESEEIRYLYSTSILLNTATITVRNSTEIDLVFTLKLHRKTHRITRHYSAEQPKQPNKLSNFKKVNLFIYLFTRL